MYIVVILREKIQKGREIEGVIIGFAILEEWLQIYSVLRDRLSKKITFEQSPKEVSEGSHMISGFKGISSRKNRKVSAYLKFLRNSRLSLISKTLLWLSEMEIHLKVSSTGIISNDLQLQNYVGCWVEKRLTLLNSLLTARTDYEVNEV